MVIHASDIVVSHSLWFLFCSLPSIWFLRLAAAPTPDPRFVAPSSGFILGRNRPLSCSLRELPVPPPIAPRAGKVTSGERVCFCLECDAFVMLTLLRHPHD